MKNALILILFLSFVAAKEFSMEDIKNTVLQAYIKRAELDQVAYMQEFRNNLKYYGGKIGITIEELVCSTAVIVRNLENNPKLWAEKVIVEKEKEDFLIFLFTLSIHGDTSAINTMFELLHGVNGEKKFAPFAANTLFNSPTPWYPIAKIIINDGNSSLRYKLYITYLKRFVYEKKMENQKQKDSLVNIVSEGLMAEVDPDILWAADQLLVTIEGNEYKYSKERFYTLNRQLKSERMQKNIKEKKYMVTALKKNLPKIIQEADERDSLCTNIKYRKLFKIEENLDTVKLNWEIIE